MSGDGLWRPDGLSLADPVRLRCEQVGMDACGGVLLTCDDSERSR